MNEFWQGVLCAIGAYAIISVVLLGWLYCACKLSHKDEEKSDGSLRDKLYK